MPAASNPSLRICLISYRSNPHCGGQGVYIRHLSRALTQLGHRVTVLSGPPDPQLDKGIALIRLHGLDLYNPSDPFRLPKLRELAQPLNLLEWLGVSTMGFPEPFTFGLRAFRYLRSRLNDFDVLHDNQSLSYGIWALGRRIPLVATIHHPITVDRQIALRAARSPLRKMKELRWYSFIAMQKRVARNLARIITVSETSRDDILGAFGVAAGRCRVVPNGIDTEVFRPLPGIMREADRVIVTNSADTPLKGLRFLLEAVASVRRRRPVHLIVVGTPRRGGAIEHLVRHLDLGETVTFTGRLSEAAFVQEYARAAVAVVPSVYEGFGLPAGEAMACAVPVISTSGGALPAVVGEAGVLVPPGDAAALSRALADLLDRPAYARRLGAAGYARVQAHFGWRRAAERTVAVYRETIHAHR
jgi:glycosyltransferase involved in cell wall biosynthesis